MICICNPKTCKMELLKLLIKASPLQTLSILLIAMTAGITGGIIVPFVMTIAERVAANQPSRLYIWFLPVLAALFVLSKRFSQLQVAALTEQTVEQTFVRITDTLRRTELEQFERLHRAEMYVNLTYMQTITNAATKSIDLFQNVIVIVVCWVYLFLLSAQAGLVFLLAFALVVAVVEVFQALTKPLVHEEADIETRLFASFQHLLDGFKEIKLSHRKNEDLFHTYLTPLVTTTQAIRIRLLFYFSEYTLFITACLYLVMGINIFFLFLVYPAGVVIKLLTITLYITTPAFIIYDALPYITNGKVALQRLQHVVRELNVQDTLGEDLYRPTRQVIQRFQDIVLKNVVFTYQDLQGAPGFSIGPINMHIQQGAIVFLTGGNGSGKSTFIKVLTGLYRPTSGIITMNDRPVNMANQRAIFSAVFTDFHLFDRLYGMETIAPQQVHRLVTQMELAGKTSWVDDRFSTLALSAGQQKRLALIVALLEDKPVYVFDEWAADQDPHFRRYFYEDLLPSLKAQGKTIIAVTHDDAYFHKADRIVKMEYGKILEDMAG